MDYSIKNLPKSEVEIKITVPAEKMLEYYKQASEEISRDIKVKGFRPGNVPPHVLEGYVDKKFMNAHAQELAIKKAYAKVVIDEKLQVVTRPKVKVDSESPLTFTATVGILPDVEIKDYKSIKIPKKEVKVTDKDIDAVVDDMKKHGTTYNEVDRGAKKGDRVEIDFEGFDENGKAIENTQSKNHPVIIGQETLVKGFEEELVGLKKGEEKEFKITFPKDYFKKDFQNKKLKFKVKIHVVSEPLTPELTEDFIEKMTGKKHKVEEFKKEIEENIKKRKEQEAEQQRESEYIEELAKRNKVELPDSLIEEEVEHLIHEMKDDVSAKGMNFDQFLEKSKMTMEDLKKKYHKEAEKRIKIRMALQYLLKAEDINVSDKEIEKEYAKVLTFYPEHEHKKIKEEYEKGNLRVQLANKLTLQKLFEKVLS